MENSLEYIKAQYTDKFGQSLSLFLYEGEDDELKELLLGSIASGKPVNLTYLEIDDMEDLGIDI